MSHIVAIVGSWQPAEKPGERTQSHETVVRARVRVQEDVMSGGSRNHAGACWADDISGGQVNGDESIIYEPIVGTLTGTHFRFSTDGPPSPPLLYAIPLVHLL
jgi:hypothetical protein